MQTSSNHCRARRNRIPAKRVQFVTSSDYPNHLPERNIIATHFGRG